MSAILRLSLNVAALDRAAAFYIDALGFKPGAATPLDPAIAAQLGGTAKTLRLHLGAQEMELVEFATLGRPYPPGSTAADLWFQHLAIVVSDMEAAYAQIRTQPFTPITEGPPQRLPPSTGSVTAFKFRDPDGHPLELIHFPPGTGAAVWQAGHGVFLGIDHTAISVADIGRSTKFYAGLGLHQTAHSVNSGPEQARLDGLAAPVVDVVALSPSHSPPHVELLGYRTPRGRPRQDAGPKDIATTRTVLKSDRSELLYDPDGHAVLLSPPTDSGNRNATPHP